ncbi:MAG: hypothetical protein O3B95_12050, partial [Chloroflexi bacterium]|nr:hypothetical protein [Chloroflexota bacterium]
MTTHKHIHTISVFAFSLILAVLGPAVTASAALLDNLVGYWQYENNYDDSSVSNNDMQVGAGAPTFGTGANAQIGTFALNVDSGEYAETQSNITGLVTGSNARTMNLWFRTDADGTNAIASYGTNTIGQLFETLLLASGLHSAHTSWEGHFWGGGGYETGLGGILPVVTVGQW